MAANDEARPRARPAVPVSGHFIREEFYMIATFLCVALIGVFGSFLGSEIGMAELGPVLSISAGVCIIESAKLKAKRGQDGGADGSARQ